MSNAPTKDSTRLVGAPVRRPSDPRVLRGAGRYLADVHLPGVLEAAVLRSPHAHARINRIDVDRALALPGVAAVLTGRDVAGLTHPLPVPIVVPGQKQHVCPVLPVDKVRYVGEAVAAVAARDRYSAEDALELIDVEYEPLPAVVDADQAVDLSSPLLYEEWGDNVAFELRVRGGEIDRALAEADVVLRERFHAGRCSGVSLEGRGAVAEYQRASGELTLWSSTQIPHELRTVLSEVLGLPEHRIRVIVPDVGGGFGNKDHPYPEEMLVCLLAMRAARPVRWVEDRREHLVATVHAREQVQHVELAAMNDGTIVGVRNRILVDTGANLHARGPGPATLSTICMPGPYRFQHYESIARGVATNKTPYGGYRGYGNPQSVFSMERMVDLLAEHLGMDPAEVRLKNMIQPSEMPFVSAAGRRYDSGDYPASLRQVLEMIDYGGWQARQAELRTQGRFIGAGMATNVESTGLGPAWLIERQGWRVGGYETAVVRMGPDGTVAVLIGTPSIGQGIEVAVAQLCADELEVPIEQVMVVWNDTAQTPYSGLGTVASRCMPIVGSAVLLAARKVREKLIDMAAHRLEVAAGDVELAEGQFRVRGTGTGIPLPSLARQMHIGVGLPPGMSPGLEERATFQPEQVPFTYMSQAAVVEVDVETATIEILRYAGVDDCGKIVNPAEVEGQLLGGIAQGLGEALLEELVYGSDGQLLAGTLMDYLLPASTDVPRIDLAHLETPSPHIERGMKGVGEAGIMTPMAVIANAVVDALSPFEIQITQAPVTPTYLRDLIRAAARGSGASGEQHAV